MSAPTRITLEESELPRRWHNVLADLPSSPALPLHPGTGQPVGPDDLAPLCCTRRSSARGTYAYDFGDVAGMTPLLKMHTLGHDFVPDPIHAGGLHYHGMSPLISHIADLGLIEAVAKTQLECFTAGVQFARTEGIVPAPEPTHALAACIEEALACKESGEPKVILTALCGHGHLDLAAYDAFLSGAMVDHELATADVEAALAQLPKVDAQ